MPQLWSTETNVQLWAGEQQVVCHFPDRSLLLQIWWRYFCHNIMYLEVIWEKYKVRKGKVSSLLTHKINT